MLSAEDVRIEPSGCGWRLAATAHAPGADPFPLVFAVSSADVPPPPFPGDVLAAALLPAAMRLGLTLTIGAPVSLRLRRNMEVAQDILLRSFAGMRRVTVNAPRPDGSRDVQRDRGVGAFFTCGVDSFYTLLKSLHGQRADVEPITHLAYVTGFDLRPDQRQLLEQTHAGVSEVARTTGKKVVLVETNLRALVDRFLSWEDQHGSALGAIGQLLSGAVRRMLIPATLAYDQPHKLGSTPALDMRWSGDGVEIVHDGAELARGEKVRDWIARSDVALRLLRVCWQNLDGALNCGRCEKCVRTMLSLHAAGVLEQCPVFDAPLRIRNVLCSKGTKLSHIMYLAENRRLLAARSQDRHTRLLLAAATVKHVARRLAVAAQLLRGRFEFPL